MGSSWKSECFPGNVLRMRAVPAAFVLHVRNIAREDRLAVDTSPGAA
jgi:hypothetical protein